MRRRTIFARLLLPSMLALLLLPPLSCLIFRQAARSHAYAEAERALQALQAQIAPLAERSFSAEGGGDPVERFLGSAGPLASQLGGSARLMLLAGEMQLVYPRDEALRAAAQPLAEAFAQWIEAGGASGGAAAVELDDGETYLLSFSEVPLASQRLRYIVLYCPRAQIGGWVEDATVLVLAIASAFVAATLLVLWAAARSVARPLRRLCREAERIGGGRFEKIEPAFRLRELEELRRAMNRMSGQLRRAEQSQKDFFQNVSHELRNPLMSIGGYAQGIEQGVFPSPQAAAHTILSESQRLTELVGGLLSLSRLEGGEARALGPLRLADAMEECLGRMSGLALQRGVSLELSPFDQELCARGEGELLGKAMENLLSNAIRYAKRAVTVSIFAEGDWVKICVADDGDGIDEKDLPRLFERCYKGRGGNFGLGLAIARSAAEQMEGKIEAANRPVGGAAFTLSLRAR